MALSVFRYSIQ